MPRRSYNETHYRLFLTSLSWAMALSGAWLLATAMGDAYSKYRAEAWPTTQGTVTVAKREVVSSAVFHAFIGTESWSATSYEYVVESTPYHGSRVAFGTALPRDYDDGALAVGRTVTVHYNPEHPEEAVLFPGGVGGPLVYTAAALFFFWVSRRLVAIRDEPPPRKTHRQG